MITGAGGVRAIVSSPAKKRAGLPKPLYPRGSFTQRPNPVTGNWSVVSFWTLKDGHLWTYFSGDFSASESAALFQGCIASPPGLGVPGLTGGELYNAVVRPVTYQKVF